MYNRIQDTNITFTCKKIEKDIFQILFNSSIEYVYTFNPGDVVVVNDDKTYFTVINEIKNLAINLELKSGEEYITKDNERVSISKIKIYPNNNMDYAIFVPKNIVNSKFIQAELDLINRSNGLINYNLNVFKQKQQEENVLYSNGRGLTNNELLFCEYLGLDKNKIQNKKKLLYHYYKYQVKDIKSLINYIKSLFEITLPIDIIRYWINDEGNFSETQEDSSYYRSNIIKVQVSSQFIKKALLFNIIAENINNVSLLSIESKEVIIISFNLYSSSSFFYQGFYINPFFK